MDFITSIPTFILKFLKKLVGLPLTMFILFVFIVLPILLAVFLASERATRGIERLEDNLMVVQSTQFELLQELSSKSATNSATVSGKVK